MQGYVMPNADNLAGDTAAPFMSTKCGDVHQLNVQSEKAPLLAYTVTMRGLRGRDRSSRHVVAYVAKVFLAAALLIATTLSVYTSGGDANASSGHATTVTFPATNGLAKYAAPGPAATATSSSAPVLEVFQVYQPILTPEGLTDQTITSDRIFNTTVVAGDTAVSSCTQLLMYHSFGYSYGQPFVGM